MLEIKTNYSTMYHNAVYQGVRYLERYPNIKSLVIGLSGGIDSAVTALLARRVCDAIPNRKIKLIGVCIPISSNKPEETQRAQLIGNSLCYDFHTIDLTEDWKPINEMLNRHFVHLQEDEQKVKIRRGNSKARLRMMYLYNYAQANDGLVLSTDNLTEYYLGFWTLHGDVGDFGFIQDLWKTEVYGIAEWATTSFPSLNIKGLQETIDAVPTDGLGVSQSDLHQLVPSLVQEMEDTNQDPIYSRLYSYRNLYKAVDEILIRHLQPNFSPLQYTNSMHLDEQANKSVISRYKATDYKRENPFKIPREKLIC